MALTIQDHLPVQYTSKKSDLVEARSWESAYQTAIKTNPSLAPEALEQRRIDQGWDKILQKLERA